MSDASEEIRVLKARWVEVLKLVSQINRMDPTVKVFLKAPSPAAPLPDCQLIIKREQIL